jgi:hypothetical protein
MKNRYLFGMIAGAIAGIADGIATGFSANLAPILGIWEADPIEFTSVIFLTYLVANIEWNIIWGIVFGFAYGMVYERIPGKGIVKGLCFSLLFYLLLADIRTSQLLWGYRYLGEVLLGMAKGFTWTGIFASITYGLVLGYLFDKLIKRSK